MTRSYLSQYHMRIHRASDDSQLSRVSELRHVVGRSGLEPAVPSTDTAPPPARDLRPEGSFAASSAPGPDFLHFKDTFGSRRVESSLSKACLVPDVSNRRGQGTLGGWPDGPFPPSAPMTKPKQSPTPFLQRRPSFLLSMRCCVDPLSRHHELGGFAMSSRGPLKAHAGGTN